MVDIQEFLIVLVMVTFIVRVLHTILRTLIDALDSTGHKTKLTLANDLLV